MKVFIWKIKHRTELQQQQNELRKSKMFKKIKYYTSYQCRYS